MHISNVQDILAYIEKPSRYLGTEINRVLKDPSRAALRMVLAFPDLYEIGTSHFGIQILYHLLNQQASIACERVFAPARDMEAQLRHHKMPLCSLESKTPLNHFDIIGFSLLYELNYTNVLNMLDLAGLPLYSAERTSEHPLVIAGGPCVCNPEPMADFFDAMVFGDGEAVILQMTEQWIDWKKGGCGDKQVLLRQWTQLDGVYVPQFFTPRYDNAGFQHLDAKIENYTKVTRAILADLDSAPFPDQPIVPFGRPVHDRLRLEISRGCSRGCRFCQAGMIYRPVRERSPEKLLDITRRSLAATGFEDLSLLSLSTGDYTCLEGLMENLMLQGQNDRVAVSLPSIRAGTLGPKLMEMIKKVRKTGFTIAPEAGSQRMRNVINKNISFENVAETVQNAFAMGWQVIKLYFMIGLPGETQEDIEAIVRMVRQLKQIRGEVKRRGQINVSVASFVPKPHTPFQWVSQITLEDSQSKLAYLKDQLKMTGVHLKWQHPTMSILEGVLARADRRLAAVIKKAWQSGCVFDGWSDQFNFELWQQALAQSGIPIAFYTSRCRSLEEPLPWEHMDARVKASFLKAQWHEAQKNSLLSDCRYGECHQCGVCDFSRVEPRTFNHCPESSENVIQKTREEKDVRLMLTYSKLEQARFFGHLELANIFARALRRSGIGVRYSQGFHPMPRISFDDPLPVGMESQAEYLWLHASAEVGCPAMITSLNAHLPEGLRIMDCTPAAAGSSKQSLSCDCYRIHFGVAGVDHSKLMAFREADLWPFIKNPRKGRARTIDLKTCVQKIESIDRLALSLVLKRNNTFTVRPADVLMGVFDIPQNELPHYRVMKMAPQAPCF